MSGVCDAGLSTTGQPAAIAGASLWLTRFSGKLNGLIAPTTPIGTRRVKPSLPTPATLASIAIISPVSVRASTAANANVPTARRASTRAVLIGFAASLAMLWRELLVALLDPPGRGVEDLRALPREQRLARAARLRAASTAASTSSGPAFGTRPSSRPSKGSG